MWDSKLNIFQTSETVIELLGVARLSINNFLDTILFPNGLDSEYFVMQRKNKYAIHNFLYL